MLRGRWPVFSPFVDQKSFIDALRHCDQPLHTDGFFGGKKCVRHTCKKSPLGSSSVRGHSLCWLHPRMLNHIREVRAGLCAAYTAGREREKIRIRVSLSPTGVTVHAVLLFKGRMICRETRKNFHTVGSGSILVDL